MTKAPKPALQVRRVAVLAKLTKLYSARIPHLVPHTPTHPFNMGADLKQNQISDKVFGYCQNQETVSSFLAKDTKLPAYKAAEKLFGSHGLSVIETQPPKERVRASDEELERAFKCGRFGNTRPSELFLRVWHDALAALEHDHVAGVVSPSLMGSSGVVPLSIIAPLPDICRHMVRVT